MFQHRDSHTQQHANGKEAESKPTEKPSPTLEAERKDDEEKNNDKNGDVAATSSPKRDEPVSEGKEGSVTSPKGTARLQMLRKGKDDYKRFYNNLERSLKEGKKK